MTYRGKYLLMWKVMHNREGCVSERVGGVEGDFKRGKFVLGNA